jgi:type II secretory ATPase GspE/PulE/Tfp pilus assembly ATPase PilB-like protein
MQYEADDLRTSCRRSLQWSSGSEVRLLRHPFSMCRCTSTELHTATIATTAIETKTSAYSFPLKKSQLMRKVSFYRSESVHRSICHRFPRVSGHACAGRSLARNLGITRIPLALTNRRSSFSTCMTHKANSILKLFVCLPDSGFDVAFCTRLLKEDFREAFVWCASDIHIECYHKVLPARLRHFDVDKTSR